MTIRYYNPATDYNGIRALYADSSTYGGEFDEARDSEDRLKKLTHEKTWSILLAEHEGAIVGTVTLFEDGRSAWLYRFAVQSEDELAIADALLKEGVRILKEHGHTQVLVYAPKNSTGFEKRYTSLGFTKGGDYTAYWKEI